MSAPKETSAGLVLDERYELTRRLAAGGMAEIFVARQRALAGFEKDVVIKLLQAKYRQDPRVVEMFMEEARIGASLNHPNIVHVYDVGDLEGTPYIAMEYIQGEELSELCKRGLELGDFLPFAHAVDLVRQAAEGMGYYHAKRDDEGETLGIVHRDISPSNLLVTSDGGLKIIDFGIATSKRAAAHGVLPGKLNYMAPEQARGEKADHRADIYALGIVLYEVTVGRRLYKGKPEEVRERVAKGQIKPPTFVRRDFPQKLESIVMRALEPHVEDRYQNAYDMASDLQEFLHEAHLKSGPFRIAQYLDDLNAKGGADRRPELSLAGEAWVDDEGEDALDFGRTFKDVNVEGKSSTARLGRTPPAGVRGPATPLPTLVRTPQASTPVPLAKAGVEPPPPQPAPSELRAAESGEMVFPPPRFTPAPSGVPPAEALASRPAIPPAGRDSFGQAIVDKGRSPLPWVLLGAALATAAALVITMLR